MYDFKNKKMVNEKIVIEIHIHIYKCKDKNKKWVVIKIINKTLGIMWFRFVRTVYDTTRIKIKMGYNGC